MREALSYLNRAADAFRALPNKKMEGFVLEKVGPAYEAVGDVPKARVALDRLLELSRSVIDRRLEASALTGLGHILEAAGDTDRALEYYQQAVELSRVPRSPQRSIDFVQDSSFLAGLRQAQRSAIQL